MRSIISALFLGFSATCALAQSSAPIELAADAPDRHVVVTGDTLWGIANKFLQDPYRWPEVWRMNGDEVRNPHRIYPGQVIVLDRSGAQPQLRLGRLIKVEPQIYSEDIKKEIPAIPHDAIEPFLSEPLIVEAETLAKAARVVAVEESRVTAGAGYRIYAKGLESTDVRLWQAFRPGKPLIDPDSGELLGYEAIYLGTARLVADGKSAEKVVTQVDRSGVSDGTWDLLSAQKGPKELAGHPTAATLEVVSTKLEIGRGDSLIPAGKPEIISYLPHAPAEPIRGKIVSIYGGVGEAGRYSIVSMSRGKADGVEHGHVLAIYRAGGVVTNRFEGGAPEQMALPDERYGLVFVFRVFDRVSYGLVMEISRPVSTGDVVRKP
jgi:hypothetical protein